MLSPLDDLPIHQVAQTMATVGTSDRNFYDRYYFNLHGCSDELFLAAGLGQYPNLGVADAFVAVAHGSTQTVVRASRPLGDDRLDTAVGPLRVEVLAGLERLRLVCEETDGFALDVTWDAAVPAYEEPRMVHAAPHGRVLIDTMRFLQTGSWTGTLLLDGREVDVTPDRFWGNRDRSWGVRPVGEPEPAGAASAVPPGFFWNYVVARFDGLLAGLHGAGGPPGPAFAGGGRAAACGRLGRAPGETRAPAGVRARRPPLVRRATVRFGGGLVLEAEVLRPLHIARGTGYGFDADWRHGMWQGPELVVQRLDLDTDDPSIVPIPGAIVDNVARFTTNRGHEGYGLLEVMVLGPHVQYFDGWD